MTSDKVITKKIGKSAAKSLSAFDKHMGKVQRLDGCGSEEFYQL
jgi:hypothetical protein